MTFSKSGVASRWTALTSADRIEREFYELFETVARMPGQGHTRKDLTKRRVLFFPMYSFLVVYELGPTPIRILAVVRGRRDVKRLLRKRP